MKVKGFLAVALVAAAVLPTPVTLAAEAAKKFVVVNEDVGVPVFPYDITDRPYQVVGEVKAGVRKATIFSKAPTELSQFKQKY